MKLLRRLIIRSDILVQNHPRSTSEDLGLAFPTPADLNPRLVVTSITYFGQTGPYRDLAATDIVTSALSGLMYHSGDSDREPLRNALNQSFYVAGVNGAVATTAALFQRLATGRGQHFDVSTMECLASHLVQAVPYYNYYVDTHHAQFVDTTRTLNGPYPDNNPGEGYYNRAGTFQTLNRGKRSLTLDLRTNGAVAVLQRLVAVSDVVLENFTPRVMRRFGLDYPDLKLHRPDLIMVSNTGYDHSGPWSDFGAMATALEPTHGTGAFMGYLESNTDGHLVPGSVPNKKIGSGTGRRQPLCDVPGVGNEGI
jgi:crotonobetainyl-CoA:carnitine CoA-transferase CaiB-like acyl-CoA transferase